MRGFRKTATAVPMSQEIEVMRELRDAKERLEAAGWKLELTGAHLVSVGSLLGLAADTIESLTSATRSSAPLPDSVRLVAREGQK